MHTAWWMSATFKFVQLYNLIKKIIKSFISGNCSRNEVFDECSQPEEFAATCDNLIPAAGVQAPPVCVKRCVFN